MASVRRQQQLQGDLRGLRRGAKPAGAGLDAASAGAGAWRCLRRGDDMTKRDEFVDWAISKGHHVKGCYWTDELKDLWSAWQEATGRAAKVCKDYADACSSTVGGDRAADAADWCDAAIRGLKRSD